MKLVVNNKQKDVEMIKATTLQFQMRCGAFFRKRRVLQNKVQEDVARLLNVSVRTIDDYETGKKAIPLYHVDALSVYLQIPPEEIMELHLDLEKKIMPKLFFDPHFKTGRNLGGIIKQARKTVFLSAKSLAQLLSQSGYLISEDEITQIESEEAEASAEFWIGFCTLVHMEADAIQGYSRWQHLMQVSRALKNNEIRIPVGSKLFNALENYHSASQANAYKASYLLEYSLASRRGWPRPA